MALVSPISSVSPLQGDLSPSGGAVERALRLEMEMEILWRMSGYESDDEEVQEEEKG